MENKPLIYIASPYTKGDVAVNTRFQMKVFDELLTEGLVLPYAPLVSHFQHLAFPRPYADWLSYDKGLIRRGMFDACLRLTVEESRLVGYTQSESSGADEEVRLFREMDLPVFFSREDLAKWVRSR